MQIVRETFVQKTAPNVTNVHWVDTSDPQSPKLKVYVDGEWRDSDSISEEEVKRYAEEVCISKDSIDTAVTEKPDDTTVPSTNAVNEILKDKISEPVIAGTEGQILQLDAELNPVWATVQGEGIIPDVAMSDSSTNAVQNKVIKKYVDNVDDKKANKDGYYEQLVSGAAKNLEAPITVSDTFLTRPTGGEGAEVADGVAQILEAEGNSVKFNQLAKALRNADYTPSNVTVSYSNGVATLTSATDASGAKKLTLDNFVPTSGHKYYLAATIDATHSSTAAFVAMRLSTNAIEFLSSIAAGSKGRTSNIGTVSSSIMFCLSMGNATPSGEYAIFEDVLCIDLTAIFGSGNEPATAADFEAWLEANVGLRAYYPYTTGTVLNNCMEGIAAPGYNLLDPATGKAQIIGAYSDLYGNYYGIVGTHGALTFTDAYGNSSTITPDSDGKFELTVPGELSVASAGDDCAVFLWWDGTKKEYQPYELNESFLDVKHIYGKLNGAGDLVQVWADGMPGDDDARDILHVVDGETVADRIYEQDTPLRYTDLVYQGSSHFADGTPVTLPVTYKVNNWSIESIIPQNTSSALVTAPPVLTCKYSLGAVDLLNTHTDEIADLYATKADTEGSYPGIISGNLVDVNGTGTDQEFVYRPTGGGEALAGNSNGVVQTIKGRTLVWNQLAKALTTTNYTVENVVITQDGASLKVESATSVSGAKRAILNGFTPVAGHKYYIAATIDTTNTSLNATVAMRLGNNTTEFSANVVSGTAAARVSVVGTVTSSIYFCMTLGNSTPEGDYAIFSDVICIDLTAMFGAGNEPATVAEFEALYPESYYSYNAGTLLPFKGTGLKVTGQNQWDEQFIRDKSWNTTTGAIRDDTGWSVNKNPIRVLPNTTYYYKGAWTSRRLLLYDSQMNYIQFISETGNGTFTTPANAAYLNFYYQTASGDNTCINLSNPAINGQYFPYEEHTISLPVVGKTAKDGNGNPIVPFPEGMHGTPTAYDVARKADGSKVVEIKDLNELSFSMTVNGRGFLTTGLSGLASFNKPICERYDCKLAPSDTDIINGPDKTLYIKNSGNIFIKDSSYATVEDFQASLTGGVKLVYSLATPVPFTWDEPLDMIYPAPAGGTEAIIPQGVDESGVPATAPLKATIFYSKDYVQTINDMPKDFDTTASIDALASALATTLSTALNGTFTITRGAYDESAKKYGWTVSFTSDEEE